MNEWTDINQISIDKYHETEENFSGRKDVREDCVKREISVRVKRPVDLGPYSQFTFIDERELKIRTLFCNFQRQCRYRYNCAAFLPYIYATITILLSKVKNKPVG